MMLTLAACNMNTAKPGAVPAAGEAEGYTEDYTEVYIPEDEAGNEYAAAYEEISFERALNRTQDLERFRIYFSARH